MWHQTDELVTIQVNGEQITSTPSHPFYVYNIGWTEASDLRAGDKLCKVNGEYAVVEWIEHQILESPVTVYNFEVEDYHTYFVGTTSVLVHNKCDKLNKQVSVYKKYTGKDPTGHVHHGLPEEAELKEWFVKQGITDIDDGRYYFDIPPEKHIYKSGNGIHTNTNRAGKTWNASWKDFKKANPNATPEEIEAELDRLAELYEISQYRAVKAGG